MASISRAARGGLRSRLAVELLEVQDVPATVPAGFADTPVAGGLTNPTAMAFAPDGRLFVTEQGGSVRIVEDGQLLPTPFLTVDADDYFERGLLGIAFDPQFDANGFVYVYYTVPDDPNTAGQQGHNRLSRFTASGNVAVPGSEAVLYEMSTVGQGNHNGGAVQFGADGKLYVAVGDNAVPANSQNLNTEFGKLLRLNKDGTAPPDNPFYDAADGIGAADAVWALGLRNPYTFAVDPASGRVFINDVGQNSFEEINTGVAGANYGWPAVEGTSGTPPTAPGTYTAPTYTYPRPDGYAVIGGAFYSPAVNRFPAGYAGKYFFADYVTGFLRTLDPATGQAAAFGSGAKNIVDLDLGPDGNLYTLQRGAAGVRRISYTGSTAPTFSTQPVDRLAAAGERPTFRAAAAATPDPKYQWQKLVGGTWQNIPRATRSSYRPPAVTLGDSGTRFRVVATNSSGSTTSREAVLTVVAGSRPTIRQNLPSKVTLYGGGDTIRFAARASDAEDGTLTGAAFSWQVLLYTSVASGSPVRRPLMPPTSGTSGSFTLPTVSPYTEPDIFYRVELTVTDSSGLTRTLSRDYGPKTAAVTLAANVGSVTFTLDGRPYAAPYTFTGVSGYDRTVWAPPEVTTGGVTYRFASWSDGGAREHVIRTPAAATTYTATYVLA